MLILEDYIYLWKRIAKCLCDCWNEKCLNLIKVRAWLTKSCWCLRKANLHLLKHWMANSKIYKTWEHMKSRCYNKNNRNYHRYGWRWISIEWATFEDFYRDMWDSFNEELSIDRINNDWNYSKENCRWTTMEVQAWNTSRALIKWWLAKYCRENNINYKKINARISKLWWSFDKAVNTL